MNFTKNEMNGFNKLFNYAWSADQDTVFKFVNGDTVTIAKVNCFYETDNSLELCDENYEEYNAIAFENIQTHEMFEINYHNLPNEIYCNDEKIL